MGNGLNKGPTEKRKRIHVKKTGDDSACLKDMLVYGKTAA